MWREGSVLVAGEVYRYWMKVYRGGSEFGIDGGPVSKLRIEKDERVVCSFDRGWDVEPVDEGTRLAMEILLHGVL